MGKFDEKKNRFFYKRKWKEMSWEIIQFLWYWLHTASVADGFLFSFHVMRKWKMLSTAAGNSIECFEFPFQLLFLEHSPLFYLFLYLRATNCRLPSCQLSILWLMVVSYDVNPFQVLGHPFNTQYFSAL